jgi:hypothetical protein
MLISRTNRLSLLTLVAAALAASSLTPAASAAGQRYASPTGTGSDCSAGNPCSVADAIGYAKAGDEVIVSPGDYHTFAITDAAPITIHGVQGQPRPRLFLSGNGNLKVVHGSTLRYLEVVRPDGATALVARNAIVDQVIARAAGTWGTVFVENSTIRNSVFVASHNSGRAVLSEAVGAGNSTVLRNVTAIATASDGVAVEAYASAGGNVSLGANNVIARGGPLGASFSARTDNSAAQATIGLGHSNYGGGALDAPGPNTLILDGGGNRAEEPVFVDAAGGDYRQAAGSPTIGAGLDDPKNGGLDVDGDLRTIGKTDIGADEFVVAPAAVTAPAGAVTDFTSGATTTPSPARPFAGVRLVSTRLTMSGRSITLKLSCPAATLGRCSGRTKLTARHRRPGSRATSTVTLGGAPFSITAGKQTKVRVRVSRAARRLLTATRRLQGRVTNAASNGAGLSKTTVAAVTIRRATAERALRGSSKP